MTEPAAVRTIERWGLLAGVTGVVANLLLAALWALAIPGLEKFEWTGPANDVVGGIVSTGALVPVAVALAALLDRRLVRVVTSLAVVAMGAMVVSSALLVADVLSFDVQVYVAIPVVVFMFGWVAAVGYVGTRGGRLPPRLARAATVIGLAGVAGLALALPGLLLPAQSVQQYVLFGAGLVVGVPAYLAFPVWLIVLSSRLRTQRTGDRPSTDQVDVRSEGNQVSGQPV